MVKHKLKTIVEKTCSFFALLIVTSLILQSQYASTLTVTSQTYRRAGTSSSSTNYYQAIQMNISTAGNYTIVCHSNMDTYGYLYNNAFDPVFPLLNLLKSNDDTGGNRQFKLKMFLQIRTQYILVTTTYDVGVTGSFSIIATGPTSIRFSPVNITSKNSNPSMTC